MNGRSVYTQSPFNCQLHAGTNSPSRSRQALCGCYHDHWCRLDHYHRDSALRIICAQHGDSFLYGRCRGSNQLAPILQDHPNIPFCSLAANKLVISWTLSTSPPSENPAMSPIHRYT